MRIVDRVLQLPRNNENEDWYFVVCRQLPYLTLSGGSIALCIMPDPRDLRVYLPRQAPRVQCASQNRGSRGRTCIADAICR